MRKSLSALAVFVLLAGGPAVLACEGHRPVEYPVPSSPGYQPGSRPVELAAADAGGYKIAGAGAGGLLLAGSALCAFLKRS